MNVLTQDLGVMDHSAISLARENRIPIIVFSIARAGGFPEILQGGGTYTIVEGEQ
jgi:uridylate kinase